MIDFELALSGGTDLYDNRYLMKMHTQSKTQRDRQRQDCGESRGGLAVTCKGMQAGHRKHDRDKTDKTIENVSRRDSSEQRAVLHKLHEEILS